MVGLPKNEPDETKNHAYQSVFSMGCLSDRVLKFPLLVIPAATKPHLVLLVERTSTKSRWRSTGKAIPRLSF
jgi:hypothetical protein